MKRFISIPNILSMGGPLLLLGSLVLVGCGSDDGSASGNDAGATGGDGSVDPNGGTGGSDSSSSPGVDLDGQPCEAGQQVTDECSTCLCGESATYSCIFVPGCDHGDPGPDPEPQPQGPEDIEGKPCDSVENPGFECATCYCTDAGTYMCAVIANCEQVVDRCSQPQPSAKCETGWICDEASWTCLDNPDCPKFAAPPDVACTDQVVEYYNPRSATCCSYASPCEAPTWWPTCDQASSGTK